MGLFIIVVENVEEYFFFSDKFVFSDDYVFMFEIMGESMIEVGILDGDMVIVC